jgi:hypothetical protein
VFAKRASNDEIEDLQQQLVRASAGRSLRAVSVPFVANIGADERSNVIEWNVLPGMHSEKEFTRAAAFRTMSPPAAFNTLTYASALGTNFAVSNGTAGYWLNESQALGDTCTGAHAGLLGGIFTTGTSLWILSTTESAKQFTLANVGGFTKPVEIDGWVFFSACAPNGAEVVAYLPPPFIQMDETFGTTEGEQRRIQYFTTEHAGQGATVGLWRGKPHVATTDGVWQIVPLSDAQGWALGDQVAKWDLPSDTQFAVTNKYIVAHNGSDVVLFDGESTEIASSSRFTTLTGDGRIAVLSNSNGDAAVLSGSDWETFAYVDVVGTLMNDGVATYALSERVNALEDESVVLTTCWCTFASPIFLDSIVADGNIAGVSILTDNGNRKLVASSAQPGLWRANVRAQRLKLFITTRAGEPVKGVTVRLRKYGS